MIALAGFEVAEAFRASPIRMQAEAATTEAPPLPKIKTMMVGDGTLAGDMNFDPLMIADSPEKLAWYREAEVKHARLAMLAAFGWPISEILNFGNLLTKDGRAPSLLNGGLGEVNGVYWAAVTGLAIYWEAQGLDKKFGKQDDSSLACWASIRSAPTRRACAT